MDRIEVGYQAFTADGGEEFGAVRGISSDGKSLRVYVENAGDFFIAADAVTSVHSQKVIFDCDKLEVPLREAIGHAHDVEDR